MTWHGQECLLDNFNLECDYLKDGDSTILEKTPLETLSKEHKLTAFRHDGFWYPMDTLRDKNHLEKLWTSGKPPWKTW